MIKISVYVPESHLDCVKEAMFVAGAGKIGNYQRCCWQTLGQGQFLPGDGSKPFVGAENSLELVSEYQVEMVCEDSVINAVIAAMKSAHPYEEPAYGAWNMLMV